MSKVVVVTAAAAVAAVAAVAATAAVLIATIDEDVFDFPFDAASAPTFTSESRRAR